MFNEDLTQAQAVQLAARAALARRSLLDYCCLINPKYKTPPHIRMAAEHFEAVERGEILRLMVFMPPRHGKSELYSGMAPSWFIGRDPDRKVILTSYAATLAETFSIQNRDTIQYNPMWPVIFPTVTISPTVRAVDKWAVTGQRESLLAAGVGGPVTGFGAHLLIIDDPVKNYEEACSKANQEKQFNWYKTTARTRLQPGAAIIIIMTRWVEDDLAGRILDSEEGSDFTILHLPARSLGVESDYPTGVPSEIAESTAFPDALGRRKDEPLWKEMGFDTAFLDSAQRSMLHDFHGLYQGMPSTPAGEKFRRTDFQVAPAPAEWELLRRARSWDLAWTESTEADWTVGLLASLWVHDEDWLVHIDDIVRARTEDPAGLILETAGADGSEVEVVMETVALQSKAFRSVRRDERMWKHRMTGVRPHVDKLIRAQPAMRLSRGGRVYVEQAGWTKDFLDELGVFPNGRYDDQVDGYTQLINHWQTVLDALLWKKKVARAVPKPRDIPFEFRVVQPKARDGLVWQVRGVYRGPSNDGDGRAGGRASRFTVARGDGSSRSDRRDEEPVGQPGGASECS